MTPRLALLAACLAGTIAPAMAAPKLTDAERAEICAEAEARYKETTGRAVGDEPVKTILTYKNLFCPMNFEVKAGDKLRFVNVDKRTSHSVWFRAAGKPESERFFPNETYETTVDLPEGDHELLCGPHWANEGMIGRVTVQGAKP